MRNTSQTVSHNSSSVPSTQSVASPATANTSEPTPAASQPSQRTASLPPSTVTGKKRMYEEYKGDDSLEQPNQSFGEDIVVEGAEFDELDEVSKEIARERLSEQSICIRNEVDQYLSDRYVSLVIKNFDIGKWWKGNEATYPILSKLAKDVFAVPSSTVASENAFSLGSRVVDPFRASLTPKTVETLVCTADWLRSDTPRFSLYDSPTEEQLDIYQELEELEKENALNQGLEGSRNG